MEAEEIIGMADGAGVAPFSRMIPEATALLSRHRLRFLDSEDSAQMLVRFDNGLVGHLVTS